MSHELPGPSSDMLTAMSGGLPVAAGAALIAGIPLLLLGRRLTLGPWRSWTGAGAFALLAGLVVGDFSIHGAGDWWASHPSAEAAATGLLLLALTVLVVEAVVARTLAASESRRWRAAAAVAASVVLDGSVDPLWRMQSVLGSISAVGRINVPSAGEWPPFAVRTLRTGIAQHRASFHQTVLEAAPVLTATDALHDLYDEMLLAIEALIGLDEAIKDWYRAGTLEGAFTADTPLDQSLTGKERLEAVRNPIPPDDEWKRQFPQTTAAWSSVADLWAAGLSHIGTFECQAVRSLGITPPDPSPWEPDQQTASGSEDAP